MGKKILIAEDDTDSRDLLEELMMIFQPYDVRVYLARDGIEAHRIACKERPNVILLDIMMPGMDGYEVCRRIKSDPDLLETYIIMISARTQADAREQAAIVGADEFINKPYEVNLILERVQTALNVNPI